MVTDVNTTVLIDVPVFKSEFDGTLLTGSS